MLGPDSEIPVNGKQVQVESILSKEDYLAGKRELGTASKPTLKEVDESCKVNIKFNSKPTEQDLDDEDEVVEVLKPRAPTSKSPAVNALIARTIPDPRPTSKETTPLRQIEPVKPVPYPKKLPTQQPFKPPGIGDAFLPVVTTINGVAECRYPTNDPSVVMRRPTDVPAGKQVVDVVIDPWLARQLRAHQKEGVKFMYECIMGMRDFDGRGAILADEMGLGKTMQVIALLWTLLKQNPIYGEEPVIKKALIVCPVTLVKNWKREFRKWLGIERIAVFTLEDKDAKISSFMTGDIYPIAIIGYEKFRTVQQELSKKIEKVQKYMAKDAAEKYTGIDIVIADEGHRLKTAKNKSAEAIKALSTKRRIILSGTPLQNDLSEFYTMVDFVNPGLLGRPNTFKKEFETPILKSRQPGVGEDAIGKGEEASSELARITSEFILRRTSELLSQYLPPKSEYIIFCKPSQEQAEIYRHVLASPVFGAVLGSPEASLQLINILKKVCNSPTLLRGKDDPTGKSSSSKIASLFTNLKMPPRPSSSSKFRVLDQLLDKIYLKGEKVVLVSHYTSTLDILGTLVNALGYTYLRLDGTTPANKRQDLVDKFNRDDHKRTFAFLLSAKSGGAGLNLIGASRLILYDNDWNPALDLQAMARIHRDGQKRPCKIYRLLTRGALDEKIYQRQISKLSLADSIVDNKSSKSTFTREELRRLFTLDETSECQTHDLIGCPCGGRGGTATTVEVPPATSLSGEITSPEASEVEDVVVDLTAESPEVLEEDEEELEDINTKADIITTEDISYNDSDDELPPVGALIRASQLQAQEVAIKNGTAKYVKTDRYDATPRAVQAQGKNGKMQSLMLYDHIDGRLFRKAETREQRMLKSRSILVDDDEEDDSGSTGMGDEAQNVVLEMLTEEEQEALVDDDVLRRVLQDEDALIRYVFAKTTG